MLANKAITPVADDTAFQSVLVTPVSRAESGAFPHLSSVGLCQLEEFRKRARGALAVIRQLRRTLGEDGDLAWRAEAQAKFEQMGYGAATLFRTLGTVKASDGLKR
jgi:hypothetical protein